MKIKNKKTNAVKDLLCEDLIMDSNWEETQEEGWERERKEAECWTRAATYYVF